MVLHTFEVQRQYLSSSMAIFNLTLQLIVSKGRSLLVLVIYRAMIAA